MAMPLPQTTTSVRPDTGFAGASGLRGMAAGFMLLSLLVPRSQAQEDLTREQAALAEEQMLLHRQLHRLRETMVTLAQRLEAEGRVHAAELLRAGIKHVDHRRGDGQAHTLEEWMEITREDIRTGRTNNALQNQERILETLTSLLDILMDRQGLESLEDELDQLNKVQAALSQLADEERQLREQTNALQADSKNEAHKALETGLAEAIAEQRAILADSEDRLRKAGIFDLEALRQRLRDLLKAQAVSTEVFEQWDPAGQEQLQQLRTALEKARADRGSASRLHEATAALDRAAQDLEAGHAPTLLDEAAQRAAREASASSQKQAREIAEALQHVVDQAANAKSPAELRAAAQGAQQSLAAMKVLEGEADQQAQDSLEAARSVAEQLSQRESAAGKTAQRLASLLNPASRGESDPRGKLAEAFNALDQALAAQGLMAEALEAAQDEGAREARALGKEVRSAARQGPLPQADDLQAVLERAGRELEEGAQAARMEEPEAGRIASARGTQALEEALALLEAALAAARQATDSDETRALQERQAALAEQVEELQAQAGEGSLSQQAQAQAQEAMRKAQKAMQTAAEQLQAGQQAIQAQELQRTAIDELERAQRSVEGGVEPQTEEQKQRAMDLAAKQKQIKEQLLSLAQLNEERDSPLPQPDMGKASKSAGAAQESLSQGQLDQATRQEEQTEREIRDALEDLKEEEEQYQQLRQEELLFRVTEEVDAMLTLLAEQQRATKEIHTARAGRTRISRSDRVQLRNVGREFESIGQRATKVREAIENEGVYVFAEVVRNVETDLARIARDMGENGGYQSGERVQAVQADVHRNLTWLQEALKKELSERQEGPPGGSGPQPPPPLVPDVAELKLLRMMEVEVLAKIQQQLTLHPELSGPTEDIDPLVLEDISRLAYQHNRVSELFTLFRKRLEIPGPPESKSTESGDE